MSNIIWKYQCDKCEYFTNDKPNYIKHCNTKKHIESDNANAILKCPSCKKIYKTSAGLWKHSKICVSKEIITTNEMGEMKNMIVKLLENQNVLQNTITELQNKPIEQNITNNNNNNIHIFLNEQCKNAIDIMEFCKTLEIMEHHFKIVGEKGYLAGCAEIITHNLNKYSIYQRPIHCIKNTKNENEDKIHIRYNETWTPETRQSKVILNTVVDEIDGEIYRKFELYEEKNGIMENHTKIDKTLCDSWDIKPETADKILEIVTLDATNVLQENENENETETI
jgi:uncharacterized C2H2 Zn-finger protein